MTSGPSGTGGDFANDPAGMAAFLISLGHDPATVQSVINTQFGGGQAGGQAGAAAPGLAGLPGAVGPTTPGTIGRPGQFGFAPGAVPGGDALQFLRDIGFPIPSTFSGLQTGQPLQAGDLGTASQLLGGLGIPSPQSLGRLDDTGLQLLQSIFETLLGIPFGDVVTAGRRPFQGLRSAPLGRTGLLR